MTTNTNDTSIEEIGEVSQKAHDILRRRIEEIERAREEQPALVAKAREEAEEARGWAILEEPWNTLVTALPAHDAEGKRTGNAITLPSITAKELMAARLAFDMLDAGLDAEDCPDNIEDVKNRCFTELGGDTGVLFLVCMAALDTIATLVVPQMVEELEERASNYDVRVMLAEARTKAWRGRVSEINRVTLGHEVDDDEEPQGDSTFR